MFDCLWSIWASDVGRETHGGNVLLIARREGLILICSSKSQPAAVCLLSPGLSPYLGKASTATKTSCRSDYRDVITTNWVFSLLDSDPALLPPPILSNNLPMVSANKRWLERRSCESSLNISSRAWCAPHPNLACLTISRPPHGLL